jgi:hypothetical protein
MKPEFRRELARLSFEEKIRKVAELIRLSRKVKADRLGEDSQNYPQSEIRDHATLRQSTNREAK